MPPNSVPDAALVKMVPTPASGEQMRSAGKSLRHPSACLTHALFTPPAVATVSSSMTKYEEESADLEVLRVCVTGARYAHAAEDAMVRDHRAAHSESGPHLT